VIGRRAFLATSAVMAVAPRLADAQPPGRAYRIGVLHDVGLSVAFGAFERRIGELGYVTGTNLIRDIRKADGRADRLPALAAELVRLKPDLIVSAGGVEVARALKQATTTIPIVFSAVEWDPVATGIVASLVRPGGNITGHALLATEITMKRLELLREALPRAARVAVLWQRIRAEGQLDAVRQAAESLKIQIIALEIREVPGDLDEAVKMAAQKRADALLILGTPSFYPERKRLADLALKHRLPASFQRSAYAEAGGLMAFGADIDEMWRRVADYADRILKGARPADLPIEQPIKFELVLNLKTARALGLTLPPALLGRADRIIE
jgi:putative ABC transport system substrate-binding protein